MNIIQRDVDRRSVIEAYARYDCLKKLEQVAEFAFDELFR
jgi:hypothetical protein